MSKITTHETVFERPELLKAAVDSMVVTYSENAPIPGAYSNVREEFAIDGSNVGPYRGIGYAFDSEAGRLIRKMDDMDMRRVGSGGYAPMPAIADFETRLYNHSSLALAMDMLALGRVDIQRRCSRTAPSSWM